MFFQIWPTKGYQYLLAIAPPFAILASRTLIRWLWIENPFLEAANEHNLDQGTGGWDLDYYVTKLKLADDSAGDHRRFHRWHGGVPGGREAGEWIQEEYSWPGDIVNDWTVHGKYSSILWARKALAFLSARIRFIVILPMNRSIILTPKFGQTIFNIWFGIHIQQVAPAFFSDRLLQLAARFNGRVVHTQTVTVTLEDGTKVEKPVIIIYMVHP